MLSQKQIQEIVQTIVEGYDPEKVYIFGSYVNGTPNKDSDLDICVIKETNERALDRRIQVHSLFDPYPYPMDIFVYTPIEFEENKKILNTLAFYISRSNQLMYDKKNVQAVLAKSTE